MTLKTPSRLPALFLTAAITFLVAQCSTIFRSSLPKREGVITARVSSTVRIYRDEWGVPHIFAENISDLVYAQGYVHAQERLFQMDTERRLASGRLSEIYGEEALPVDEFFTSLNLTEKAEKMYDNLDPELKRIVDRYVEGVNDAISAMRSPPPEMRILSSRPVPFNGKDILLLSLLKGFGLAQWLEELAYYAVLSRAGEELFCDINPYKRDLYGISIIPGKRSMPSPKKALKKLAEFVETALSFPFFPTSGGSNSWVVSGTKTESGAPYLFNDPHLPLTCPSVWFENHLIAPGIDVYGFSFPGAPFVIIGFNRNVAWGFTNVMMDDLDLFIEKFVDESTYLRGGREKTVASKKTAIPVRGGKIAEIELRETIHGPIVSPTIAGIGAEFAVRWTGFDATGDHLRSFMLLNSAKSAEDVLEALSHFQFPAQNVVFATADGHIGYVLAGKIPVRRKNHPPIPVPGDTGEFDWIGYLPFEKNPKVLDPPEGFIATANFPPVSPEGDLYISSVYEPSSRGKRIISYLRSKSTFTPKELRRLQTDVVLSDFDRVTSLFVSLLGDGNWDETQKKAMEALRNWDGLVSEESAGAAVFEVLYERVLENTFGDELGTDGYMVFSRTLRVPVLSLETLLFKKPNSKWFDDQRTRERRETIRDVVVKSFEETTEYLKNEFGSDVASWKWGRLHKVVMRHPFGKKWYLRKFFNIGPAGAPGSGRTVWKMEYPHGRGFTAVVGPSLRIAVSPANPEEARVIITTGQSGFFFEDHYRDQFPLWLDGKYRKVHYEAKPRPGSGKLLVLIPAKNPRAEMQVDHPHDKRL